MRAIDGGPGAQRPHSPSVHLRTADAGDVGSVAKLHALLIQEGFLSSLGERFLRRLYRRLLRSDGSVLLVAVPHGERGTVAGFVAGSRAVPALFSDFARHDALPAALGSPWRIARSWRKVLETRRRGSTADDRGDGELLAIAVAPDWRRRDVGGQLVSALLAGLHGAGADSVDVVVGADNEPAIALYRRAGFLPLRTTEVHAGVSSLLLRHIGGGD